MKKIIMGFVGILLMLGLGGCDNSLAGVVQEKVSDTGWEQYEIFVKGEHVEIDKDKWLDIEIGDTVVISNHIFPKADVKIIKKTEKAYKEN